MKIEYRKVDEKRGIVQITTPDERWYTAIPTKTLTQLKSLSQEHFYPSVTWIGSYYPKGIRYMKWLADKGWDKAEEVKNEAAEKGSRVHHACTDLMNRQEVNMDAKYPNSEGELAELTAEEYGIIMTFHAFLQEEHPKIIATNYTVLNHKDKYGGTVDVKCRIKSDSYQFVHVVDIKTSSEIWPSHEIQVSAYKATDPESQKTDILQVGYRRNKNGWKLTEIPDQYDVFLSTKRIWQKETEGVIVPQREYPLSLKWKHEEPKATENPAHKTSIKELPEAKKKLVKKVKVIRKKQ